MDELADSKCEFIFCIVSPHDSSAYSTSYPGSFHFDDMGLDTRLRRIGQELLN